MTSPPPSPSPAPSSKSQTIWDYKPWWCQPWSILLTGNGVIVASWFGLHHYWITGLIALPLVAWMGFFLLIYPKAVADSGLLDELAKSSKT